MNAPSFTKTVESSKHRKIFLQGKNSGLILYAYSLLAKTCRVIIQDIIRFYLYTSQIAFNQHIDPPLYGNRDSFIFKKMGLSLFLREMKSSDHEKELFLFQGRWVPRSWRHSLIDGCQSAFAQCLQRIRSSLDSDYFQSMYISFLRFNWYELSD